MIDINDYVVDGKVKRARIVADVKRGRITREDIIELDNNKCISDSYFGDASIKKRDASEWNSRYLDELSLVAVSEAFSKDYLLYLNEVATFLSERREAKERNNNLIKCVAAIAVIIVLIVCVIFFVVSKAPKETSHVSISSVAITENTYLCLVKILG